jgi:hypothetical protein
MRTLLATAALTVLLATVPAAGALAAPSIFPSDRLTVADSRQVTGKRLNLPVRDCDARRTACEEARLLNQLDGFDLDPRIEIGFGQPIALDRVTPQSVYVEPTGGGARIALNRLVWSPARNTLYGHPERQLAESTTYRIVVTGAVCGVPASSTFTTMSASRGLAQMRAQLDDGSAYAAAGIAPAQRGLDFVRPNGTRTVFDASNVLRVRRYDDTGANGLQESTVPNTTSRLTDAGLYAFGSFRSPSFLTGDRVIPATPTRTGEPRVTGSQEVGFTLIVPAGAKPAGGWPVAIFGPGITRSKYDLFLAADFNAQRGIATIATDPAGHSFGPRSEASVDLAVPPSTVRFSGFGRGRDLDGDGEISNQEGVRAPLRPHPLASIGLRDGLRQTALDNMALVRAIGRGVDVDGDGGEDLRRTGVSYYAQSLGGIYGTMLMGVDPQVRAGALNVPGGPILDIARQSPSFRELVAEDLGNRTPNLLNGGRDGFTESLPLFPDPPVTRPARGAVAIQDAFASVNWINRPGSPETFAPLLRQNPLGGVGAKRILYQYAFGDETVPNPTSATLMRAGGLQDVTTFYRNDRTPTAPANPHGFLLDPRIAGRTPGQQQVADFLDSEGASIADPDGPAPVFEVPISDPATLETLNFEQEPATGEPPPEAASGATGSCTGTASGGTGGGGGEPACASRAGFRSLRVSARGRKVRFRFSKRVASPVTVGVFQTSIGRRVVGNRRVARFTGRQRSFTWNGRGNRARVRDGFLFARVRVQVAPGVTDVRRVTLRRRDGRFTRIGRSFYRRRSCGLLTQYKLGSPVFGGRGDRALRIAFRLSSPARVSIRVSRGGEVVKRFATRRRKAHTTYRLRTSAARLARGEHRVRITVRRGARTVRSPSPHGACKP